MGLERSDMTGTVLGTAFSLLLLAPVIQGFNNKVVVEVFHDKTTEAAVGQNVSLPCIVENKPDLKIVQIEWRKRDGNDTKLVVHSKGHGTHTFKPSIALQLKTNDSLEYGLLGSYLQIHRVEKQDSGIYVCDITTYPLGSISTETELKVKDDQIKCNMNNTFEVNAGENVTIHCTAHTSSDARYQWTKDEKLVSESESLELWWVSDAQAGVYTLTVNTGSNRLHAMFNITILTATTSLGTVPGLITASPPSNVTEEDWIHTRTPADIAHATSRTIQQPSAATNVTWTMSNIITSDEKQTTSLGTLPSTTDRENISVTTPPTKQEFSTSTKNLITTPIPYPSVSSDPSAVQSELFPRNVSEWTTSGNVRPVFRSTQDMTSYETAPDASPVTHAEEPSTLGSVNIISEKPDVSSTVSSKDNVVIEKGGGELTYVLLIIFPILALIALVGISYWRRKRRMDLPPPFKPPPPPVKYSSLRPHEILMTDIVSS